MEFTQCGDCKCWDREHKEEVREIEGTEVGKVIGYTADCLRYPPQVQLRKSGNDETLYPVTFEEDGCFDGELLPVEDMVKIEEKGV